MELHSKRSPSGGDWWGNCPGAPAYCESQGLVSKGGPAAEWGTKVHSLSEKAANYILGRGPAPVFSKAISDAEEQQVVEAYTSALFTPDEEQFPPAERLCGCPPKAWVMGVEVKGSTPQHLPHSAGTMDFVACCEKHGLLRVSDLKTGYSEVEARNNIQCVIYALHALLTNAAKINRVVIEIIQPRAPSGITVKRWALTTLELMEWLPVVKRKVARSMAPNAPLIAGEKQCKYCPAAAVCPERRKGVVRAAQLQFGLEVNATREDVAEALNLVPQLRAWIKSVESYAYQQANSGVQIPGYKLAKQRDGNREWIDEDMAIKMLGEGMYAPRKALSPAQAEKIFDKEAVNKLCKREPGGTVLVVESDPRPAVVQNKLATFQNLINKT